MKKFALIAFSSLLLSGCQLIAPYSVTFTTPDGGEVEPFNDTLDLVVSQPAYAYISEIACEDVETIALLPVVEKEGNPMKAHNLFLGGLDGYPEGTECEVTVTVFDQTTSSTSSASIDLVVGYPEDRPVDGLFEEAGSDEDENLELVEEEIEEVEVLEETPTEDEVSAPEEVIQSPANE